MRLTPRNAANEATKFLCSIPPYPGHYRGRGIVTCGGGIKYGPCVWVLVRLLRQLGCRLPIEVWYLGEQEGDPRWIELLQPLDVVLRNARDMLARYPHRRLRGWELKPYAIQHSSFREVLFLDADNVPVRDPAFLFDHPAYLATGALFWPDPQHLKTSPDSPLWQIFGLPYRPGPDQESGQLLIDKQRCWSALNLCNWYNSHSDFFYRHVYGDKDTFRFAWQRLDQPICWIPHFPSQKVRYTLCQFDLDGDLLFQHRFFHKWSLYRPNPQIPNFKHQDLCLRFLEELRSAWTPWKHLLRHVNATERRQMSTLALAEYMYERVGQSRWPISLRKDGYIEQGHNPSLQFWRIEKQCLDLHVQMGRFASRDDIGVVGGISLYRAYFVPGGVDPYGLFSIVPPLLAALTAVTTNGNDTYPPERMSELPISQGTPCAFILLDKGAKPYGDLHYAQARHVADKDHIKKNVADRQEILDFVKEKKCCTLFILGHQGGDLPGTRKNPGGAVTYPDPGDWTKTPHYIFPAAKPRMDVTFDWDPQFEKSLKTWFSSSESGCGGRCVINLVTCGGTTPDHNKTRQDIANNTGCLVCGTSVPKITYKPISSLNPSSPKCVTLGEPLTDPPIPRWPYACKTPTSGGWEKGWVTWTKHVAIIFGVLIAIDIPDKWSYVPTE